MVAAQGRRGELMGGIGRGRIGRENREGRNWERMVRRVGCARISARRGRVMGKGKCHGEGGAYVRDRGWSWRGN